MKKKIKIALSGISPELTTRLMYFYNFRKRLDLRHPSGINEKLQYLKLRTYYENPVVTECVDKYRVRDYLERRGYGDLLPGLLGGAYSHAEELRKDWDSFPEKLVIKCNHGCGYNILITDKSSEDLEQIIETLNGWMAEDYWKVYCEPQYKDVPKRIIVEEYLGDDIQTFKFYCFNGVPRIAYVSSNGENGEKDLYLDYFDMEWNHLPITLGDHLHSKVPAPKPDNLDEMLRLSKELSADFPFVRVDLYNVDGQIFFSELTFIPTGGAMKLKPESTIDTWGEWLSL